jgi:flagellar biogenesis protein FliO
MLLRSMLADMTPPSTTSFGTDFLKMFLMLGLVLGLAFVSVIFLRSMMGQKMKQLNRASGIKILERRILSQKSSIYLIDVLGKGLIISESPGGGIQLISEFPPGTDLELRLAEEEAQTKSTSSIKESLQKNLSRFLKRDQVKP